MFREISGNRDINITHDLSRRMSTSRFVRFRNYDNDLHVASKIEIRQSNVKEAQ